MAMSRIWQQRISRTQGALTKFGKPAVLILAALAGLNMLWQLLFATAPDLTEPSRAVVNRSAVVGAFAQDFVAVWLEANTQDAASLSQFISADPASLTLPSTPAVVINTPTIVAVSLEGLAGQESDAEVYSVVVGVTQRPYESAAPHRALYRVPVLWSRFGPRAASFPARIGGPGAGADLPLSYPSTLSEADPAYSTATGFLKAYLTPAGGVEQYVTTDSMIAGLGNAYETLSVQGVTALGVPSSVPADGELARVLVRVTAVNSQFAPSPLVYPLTLRGVGGRWLVAAIDKAPAVSTDDSLVPAAVSTDWSSATPN